jgi:hypothetical protein
LLTALRSRGLSAPRLVVPYLLLLSLFAVSRIFLLVLTIREPSLNIPSSTGDVRYYYEGWYSVLSHGSFPHDDMRWQYPPAAALAILAPGLLPFSYDTSFYLASFAFDVLAFGVLLRACHVRLERTPSGRLRRPAWAAWVWAIGVPLGGPIVYGRYDLIVTSVTICALVLLLGPAGRARKVQQSLGGALVGLGVLIKIWPALILLALGPVQRARRAWVSAAISGVAILGAFCLTMPNALEFIGHQGHRGIEIESLGALPFQIAVHHGWDGRLVNYDSFEYVGSWTNAVALLCLISSLLAVAWLVAWRVTVRTWNTSTVADAALVALLLFVITSRVISPQYMVWLVGLGAACALNFGPRGDSVMRLPVVLVLAATGLSAVEFPYWFDDLIRADRGAVLLLTVRNLLLVSAALIGAARLWRSTRGGAVATAGDRDEPVPAEQAEGVPPAPRAGSRELDSTSRP